MSQLANIMRKREWAKESMKRVDYPLLQRERKVLDLGAMLSGTTKMMKLEEGLGSGGNGERRSIYVDYIDKREMCDELHVCSNISGFGWWGNLNVQDINIFDNNVI